MLLSVSFSQWLKQVCVLECWDPRESLDLLPPLTIYSFLDGNDPLGDAFGPALWFGCVSFSWRSHDLDVVFKNH